MLVARPKGVKGNNPLPFPVPSKILQATLAELSARYPGDQALAGLSPSSAAKPQPQNSAGLVLGKKTGQLYPVTADQIRKNGNFIHPTPAGTGNCSEWAKGFVGYQGNAWIANRTGTLKFNAFGDVSSYKAASEKLFREMNAVRGLNTSTTVAFNPRVQAIVGSLLPAPISLKDSMKIGDVVGMYFVGSGHHGEAFFESCSGWNLTNKSQATSTCVNSADGRPWDSTMMGKRANFTIVSPFAMNTHLGFVGGTLDGEPLIFHNMNGQVHVNRLSTITTAKCYPVWIKQGNYSAGGSVTAGLEATANDMMKKLRSFLPE